MNSEPPLAAPPAALPYFVRRAGVFGQMYALFKRYAIYKQPGSILSWISKLIIAAILSLIIGYIYWDVPGTDHDLKFNDRFGYHHCVMIVCVFPLLLMSIRDIHLDRKYAEKDISLKFYGRTVYIVTQVRQLRSFFFCYCNKVKKKKEENHYRTFKLIMLYLLQILLNLLPSLCIWLAYLLPAHTMSGLYSGSNEFSIWEYIGE